MYSNIGGKIKGLAKVLAVLQAALFIIAGIRMLKASKLLGTETALIGVGFILIGPIVAWALSWVLYGVGELIETNTDIRNRLCMSNQLFGGNTGGATPPSPYVQQQPPYAQPQPPYVQQQPPQATVPTPPAPPQAVAPQQTPAQDQTAPKFCTGCGKPWVSGAQTCLGCGAKIE